MTEQTDELFREEFNLYMRGTTQAEMEAEWPKWRDRRLLKMLSRAPLINPPSSPLTPVPGSKFYLQIRICEEHYSGAKHLKKEYQILLPANVAGLDGEALLELVTVKGQTWAELAIPVILQEPSYDSPEESTQTAEEKERWIQTQREITL